MPRTRFIRPNFYRNEELGECSIEARLFFTGLWCFADKEGRLEDRPKRLKVDILPYDDCNVNELLDSLAQAGFLIRYEAGGQKYIQVKNWHKHQHPHYREDASVIPAPEGYVDDSASTPDDDATSEQPPSELEPKSKQPPSNIGATLTQTSTNIDATPEHLGASSCSDALLNTTYPLLGSSPSLPSSEREPTLEDQQGTRDEANPERQEGSLKQTSAPANAVAPALASKTSKKAAVADTDFEPWALRCWENFPRNKEGLRVGARADFFKALKQIPISKRDDVERAIEIYRNTGAAKAGMVRNAPSWVRAGDWETLLETPVTPSKGEKGYEPSGAKGKAIVDGYREIIDREQARGNLGPAIPGSDFEELHTGDTRGARYNGRYLE